MRRRSQRGVTLIELLIATTLVAALSTGMLMAVRVGLITLDKTDKRLMANRKVIAANQILYREISGAMPVVGGCGPVFRGTNQILRVVSSYSIAEGSRGAPNVLEFAVIPSNLGGVRLIVNQTPYIGPSSTLQFCGDAAGAPPQATAQSFVLADRLAYCRLTYKVRIPNSVVSGPWIDHWDQPDFPAAVYVDMAPLEPDPANLPLLSVTIPLHINRQVLSPYFDDTW